MTTLYLHIGLPKTATSTVQGAIQKLRPALQARGYWTPQGIMAHHRFAIDGLDATDPRYSWAHYQSVAASGHDRVVTEVEGALRDGKNVLISSEYLNDCGPQATARVVAKTGIAKADVRIVVCLRRQDRYLESSYNQEVKATGRTRPFTWSPDQAAHCDWNAKLSAWAEEFGEGAIRVLVFERVIREAPGHLFTRAILRACDLAFEDRELEPLANAAEDYSNVSLPAELLEFKRIANAVTGIGELDWLVRKAMAAGIGGARYRMPRSLAADILKHYEPSNREVARRFLNESTPLFDDQLDDAAPPVSQVSTAFLSQLIALIAADARPPEGPGKRLVDALKEVTKK